MLFPSHPNPEDKVNGYMLDERNLGKVRADCVDQVLKGEIDIGEEMDEEPSEA